MELITMVYKILVLPLLILALSSAGLAQTLAPAAAGISPAQELQCASTKTTCEDFDAIVFVHGVFGDVDTFKNSQANFDWPAQFPKTVQNRAVDVYRLGYTTTLLSWAKGKNPEFDEVAKTVYDALKPLRMRQYRSIGFIAHSLGGNVVSTYIHFVKTTRGHAARSQHAFVITLATPVLGTQAADLGLLLKSILGMNDDLLESLKEDNLYLRMLKALRIQEKSRQKLFGCRPVTLHAAFEERSMGPFRIVNESSAADSVRKQVDSEIKGFPLDHSAIAKPDSAQHAVFTWVNDLIKSEYERLAKWDAAHKSLPSDERLCEKSLFIPEI
jgi:hypothetical protein